MNDLKEESCIAFIHRISHLFLFILSLMILFNTAGCKGDDLKTMHSKENLPSFVDLPQEKLYQLSQKKIFFGHQSVGINIMDGVKKITSTNNEIKFHIVETRNVTEFDRPIFAHDSDIGKNHNPQLKINDFMQLLNSGIGNKLDIAFLKFCFVDIDSKTNLNKLFTTYRENIEKLQSRYPDLTIVHFTVPLLRTERTGIVKSTKKFINTILGRKNDDFFSNSHNTARNEYNKLLTNYYSGKEPVFDLAKLESIDSAGNRETFSYNGKVYYALAPEYTDDGGHLNVNGQKYIAEQLLIFLANL